MGERGRQRDGIERAIESARERWAKDAKKVSALMSFTLLPTFLEQEVYNVAKDWKHMGRVYTCRVYMCVHVCTCVCLCACVHTLHNGSHNTLVSTG